MSLTGISQIRNHLYRLNIGAGDIRNCALRLKTDEYASLTHTHIVSGSETVKAIKNAIPSSEAIMIGSNPVSLQYQSLAIDTVVCAGDTSLSTLYQENLDYIVDYQSGLITRIDTGSIPVDSQIIVWYLYYHVYQRNVDYYIDYERGRLRRLASGDIEEGQEVLVDYLLGSSEFSDSEIEQCITEAESEIAHIIDPVYRDSTDPALQTAATCLALSLLCRNSAGITATGLGGADQDSSVWLELAESYRRTAMRLLTWFRRETPNLKAPRLT